MKWIISSGWVTLLVNLDYDYKCGLIPKVGISSFLRRGVDRGVVGPGASTEATRHRNWMFSMLGLTFNAGSSTRLQVFPFGLIGLGRRSNTTTSPEAPCT
jgi:hypothetical protein